FDHLARSGGLRLPCVQLGAVPGRAAELLVIGLGLRDHGRGLGGAPLPDPPRHHRQERGDPPAYPDRPGREGRPRPRLGGHRVRDHRDREGYGHRAVNRSVSEGASGLLVMDVDSTFLTQEVIELVAEHAGVREQVEEITTAAMRGQLDFSQSLRARVALLDGLEVSVLAQVRAALVPTPGAFGPVARAKADGWVTALVSGGFHEAIDDLAAEAGIDHVLANRFEVAGTVMTGRVAGEIVDGDVKRRTLEELARRHGLPMRRVVAIGD